MLNKVARYRGTDNDNIFVKQPGYIYTTDKGIYLIDDRKQIVKLYKSEYLDQKLESVQASDSIIQRIRSEFGSSFKFIGSVQSIEQLPASAQNGDVYQVGDKEYAYNGSEFVELGFNIDLSEYAKSSEIPTKTSELQNDSNFISNYTETDPIYNADKPNIALKSELFSGSYNDLTNKPSIPSKASDLENDVGYLTEHQDISGKVDKIQGKSLVSDDQITRLSQVDNYDDTEIRASITSKADSSSVYSKDETNNKIQEAKDSISPSDFLKNIKYYNNIEHNQQGFVTNLNNMTQSGIYIIDASLGHNPTPTQDDKGILIVTQNMQQFISNKEDTFGKNYFRYKDENEVYSGTWIASAMASDLDTKVSKEQGKGLSTNDFTNVYKTKLDSLNNYNDNEIRSQISLKANSADVYTAQEIDEKISTAISNLTSLASGALHFKGAKNSLQEVQNIPYEQVSIGDVWQVDSKMYACNQKENSQVEWVEIGTTVDLSSYAEKNSVYTKSQMDAQLENMQAQIGNINTILNNIIG